MVIGELRDVIRCEDTARKCPDWSLFAEDCYCAVKIWY